MSIDNGDALSPLKRAYLAIEQLEARLAHAERAQHAPIAIIGAGLRFPGGATDLESYWRLISGGVDAISLVPPDRWDNDALYDPDPDAPGKIASRFGGFVKDVDQFDPLFFGISPREAATMDPQQRLLLETAWEALERAGISADSIRGSLTGVFVGLTSNDYALVEREARGVEGFDQYYASGWAHSIASGRLAYILDLQGPSVSIDTACSSSLVSIHLAVQSLRAAECNLALAGGVNLMLSAETSIALSRLRMLATDGRCKAFDASADGFVRGEGCGIVALKRLADAQADGDPILAVIRGSAVNQDGRSSGLTAPNGPSQEAVIRAALADAGLEPRDVHYVEAHGTGTSLGDPIEARALSTTLGDRGDSPPLVIGSVKANVGHLEAAAGVAGLLKVALMLHHGQIPPSLHFNEPSPHIPWDELPLRVPTSLEPWPVAGERRVAGVSSFGFSGTNAHLLLEAAPPAAPRVPKAERNAHLLPISAQSPAALSELTKRYAAHLTAHPELEIANVAASAALGRAHHAERATILAASTAEAIERLSSVAADTEAPGMKRGRARSEPPAVAFLFTGQGAQYAGMGRDLYTHEPAFRAALDRCASLLAPHLDHPLLELLFAEPDTPEAALLDQTAYTQPALFALEYALAELWASWGVRPAAVAGYSLGEYVAACVAGALSLEDALRLVALRGRLMGSLPAGGAMAAVFAPEERVRAALAPYGAQLSVAAINGPEHTVISGVAEAVAQVSEALAADGVRVRPLTVSHAFHSALMDPILDDLRDALNSVTWQSPSIRIFTNLTGAGATTEVSSPDYWLRQTRQPVQFAAAVEAMRGRGFDLFLEIGPHPVLAGMGRNCDGGAEATWLPSLRRGRDECATILDSLGALYIAGLDIDWAGVTADYASCRVDLPTYPFQRQRYWVETARRSSASESRSTGVIHPLLGAQLRSALSDVQYESEIGSGDFGFLDDHRVFGRLILPAAAFVEIGLAAAKASQFDDLQDLIIQAPMAFEESETRVVQTIASPNGDGADLRIFSRGGGDDDWSLHATARLRTKAESPAPAPVDLDAIRARCAKTSSPDEQYEALGAFGIELGPALQAVRQLWRGEGEALAEIALPDGAAEEADAYRIHPALLDAAFQAIAAAIDDASGAFLPIGLERARLVAEPGIQAWCHARLRQRVEPNGSGPRETLVADLTICDADGNPLMELSGLSLKRADESAAEPLDRLLYEIAWRPSPRPAAQPEPERLIARAGALLLEEPDRAADLERYCAINEQLDELSSGYVIHALERLGWQPQPGEPLAPDKLANQLGIAAHNQRLFGRFLEILAEDGVIRLDNGGYVVERTLPAIDLAELEARRIALLDEQPDFLAELTLLGNCGPRLAEVLTGSADPLQLLFPDGDASAAEHLYTASPVARTFNAMVQSAVSAVVNADPERPLRILEVGGGTGGTTAHLLPVLPADRTEYVFTDISPAFTARAANKFSAYPFVDYRPLDIERDPADQGFEPGRYDIVLAVNVVHAVRDLRESLGYIRELLVPGGLLLLVEVTAPMRWIDLTFGLTDGWWRFTDHDLRPAYPLLKDDRWLDFLPKLGFDVASLGEELPVDQALLIARAPAERATDLAGDWLIYADIDGVGDELAASIAARGGRPVLVQQGERYERGEAGLQIDPLAAVDFERLMQEAIPDVACLTGVVYLWGLDARSASTLDELREIESRTVAGALHAVQATVACGGSPRFWLVTRGAQPAGGSEVVAAEGASLWGFGRALALEHPELRPTRVDLDPASEQPAADLLREILDAGDEAEVAVRADERLVPRLARLALPDDGNANDGAVELAIAARGTLDGLELRQAERRAPGPGEVEIRVGATGLNFKDVMNVLGMYPGDPGPLGGECAGTIVAVGAGVTDLRPGDEVVALAGGSFRSYVTTATDFVAPLPAGLSLTSAATTAIAYVTASIALEHLGQMRAGERVLIHAGTGGVGMAAVHLALAAGAEVFATAGSPEKRAFLRDLGVQHVYNSRTLDFADEVMADTGGEGVDLVLNSLAGEFVASSVRLLRRNGRFLELGKRDHMSPDEIAALDRDIDYHIIDWSETAREDPPLIKGILNDVLARVEDGRLPSLPVRAFPIEEAAGAFRYMARARHIGKVAVTYPLPAGESPIRSNGFYLITGGLRGLGLEVARRLVERGAQHLLLMGRGAPSPESLQVIAELEHFGAEVLAHQGDVARQADVEAALAEVDQTGLPLLGVFHCAGLLDDGALTQQSWERFQHVMGPKVDGAWLLHELTTGRPIEHFVLFSSVAAVLGSPGQANHSTANAYMDALAWRRRAAGLPALSINWGAWSQIGAAADGAVAERTRRQGLDAMTPERGLQALEALMRGGPAQAAVASVRWPAFLGRFDAPPPFFNEVAPITRVSTTSREETPASASSIRDALESAPPNRRLDILLDFVQTQSGLVLGLSAGQVGPYTPLNDYGLDSLMAVELRNRIGDGLALSQPLPATLVFDYPTVEAIAGYLAGTVLGIGDAEAMEPALTNGTADAGGGLVSELLDNLDALSDDEIDLLLADRASQRG